MVSYYDELGWSDIENLNVLDEGARWTCDGCGREVTTYPPGAFDAPPPDATQMFCVECAAQETK